MNWLGSCAIAGVLLACLVPAVTAFEQDHAQTADSSGVSLAIQTAPTTLPTRSRQEQVPVPDERVTETPVETEMIYEDGMVYPDSPYGSMWGDMWNSCQGWCRAGLVFGFEGSILFPVGEPSQKVILQDLTLNNRSVEGASDPGVGVGLRTWVGVEKYGWGFRVGYWTFGNSWIDPRPSVPKNAPPTFLESYYLRANVLDVELTQQLCLGRWKLDTSFGGRYASLERNATVVGYGTLGDVDVFGLAMGANEVEGAGFTFSIGKRKPIFCSCLHTFCRFRGSLLWADSTATVLTEANAISRDPSGAANSRDKAFAHKDHKENVFIAEIQLGLQLEKCLACIPAIFFVRGGFEYQHWETGDLTAVSNSFASLQGSPPPLGARVDAFANAHDGNLDLVGFFLGTGLTY